MFLLQLGILHLLIQLFFAVLIIMMILRWLLSYFINEANPVMLFMARCTEPMILPVRKRLPRTPFFDVSWLFVLVGLNIMRVLLLQALPIGW